MAKAVTLKDKDGTVLYPVTSWDLVGGSESGWQLVSEIKLATAGSSMICSLPNQYDCYKVIAAGEWVNGVSDTWLDFRMLNGTSTIASTVQRVFWQNANGAVAVLTDRPWQINIENCYAYDTFNLEFTSFKTASTQWRKFRAIANCSGQNQWYAQTQGRAQNATEPTAFQVVSGGNLGAGAFVKVFACNKPA